MEKQTIDFQVVIDEIRKSGLNDRQISERTGVHRPKITKLRLGLQRTIYYDDGVALLSLWGELV